MPQALPVLGSIGGAILGVIKAQTIIGFAARTAIGLGLSALLAPRPNTPSFDDPGRQLRFAADASGPRRFIYGETLVRGQPIFRKASGDSRKNLDMILAIGDGGPYESIEAVYFGDEELTLDGSGNVTSPSKYDGFATIVTTLGDEAQTAISSAVTNITEWTSNHRGRGVCHAYVRLVYDSEVWNSGEPQIFFKVRGRKVYDQRLDSTNGGSGTHRKDDATTWEWTQNRVLWLQDYLRSLETNGVRIGGLGLDDTLFDWSTIADAADDCDENVNVSGGGTISRYTGGGLEITSADDPVGIVNGLLSAFAGEIAPRSGYVAIYAGAAKTATVTLTDDDLNGEIEVNSMRPIREAVNSLQAAYREPDEGYEMTDAPAYSDSTWVTEDGGELFQEEINLAFEDDHRRAQRICKIIASRRREPVTIRGQFKQKALQVREGDAFTWSSVRFPSAVTGKFICTQRDINADGTVTLYGRSEDDAKYDWDETTEEQSRTAPSSITQGTDTLGLGTIDPDANAAAILGNLPEYTLRLGFSDRVYDTNLGGALGTLDTVDTAQIEDDAITQAKVGAGAIGPTEIAAGNLLVVEEVGKPSSGAARVVRDTSNNLVWHYDGSSAHLMSAEASSATGAGETVTSTTDWEVIAVTSLAGVDEDTLVGMNTSDLNFTTPDAASGAGVSAQWAVIVSSSQTSEGSTIPSGTNTLYEGATDGITFFDDGGDITVQTSDFPSAANLQPPYFLTGFTGTVYVHLCLRITTGSGSLFTTAPVINVPRIS